MNKLHACIFYAEIGCISAYAISFAPRCYSSKHGPRFEGVDEILKDPRPLGISLPHKFRVVDVITRVIEFARETSSKTMAQLVRREPAWLASCGEEEITKKTLVEIYGQHKDPTGKLSHMNIYKEHLLQTSLNAGILFPERRVWPDNPTATLPIAISGTKTCVLQPFESLLPQVSIADITDISKPEVDSGSVPGPASDSMSPE
jgi:hypothetical protein